MSGPGETAYNYAILRVVPHVHRGEFANVGVVLHARTAEFLAMRALEDGPSLRAVAGTLDVALLRRYLTWFEDICRGASDAGPLALLPLSERFHWLTSPCSDVLQSSPVHEGICDDPDRELDSLYAEFIARTPPRPLL